MVRRVIAATGSNAYGQAITIATQLLSLPLFLSRWDVATYGEWIVLSAVPAYIGMADVGMVTAAGNRMTMLAAEGKAREANAVFQSALAFVLGICACVLLFVAAVVGLWPLQGADTGQGKTAVLALSAGVMIALVGGLPEAVYKASHRYALGAALSNSIRLAEWLGGLGGLWWRGDFAGVAIGMLLPRVLLTLAMIVHAARSTPDFQWGFGAASVNEVRACAGPAISFMAFPAANALNFQGMTLIAAAVLGPAATVVFNTYRTMARVTVQATATFSHALWPEFSRLYGQRDLPSLKALFHRSQRLGLALAIGAGVAVYLAAPMVLKVWSKNQIAFSPSLMIAAMVYAAAAGAWHISRVLLLSTNEHGGLAWPFLLASVVCVPLAWLLGTAWGLIGVMLAMLLLELSMWALCAYLARRLLGDSDNARPVGVAA